MHHARKESRERDGSAEVDIAGRGGASAMVSGRIDRLAVTSDRVALPSFASHAFATVPSWPDGEAALAQ